MGGRRALGEGGLSDKLDRIDAIAADSSGTAKYAQYSYLGAGTIVGVMHPAVSGGLTLSYGAAGVYGGWDRFGRVVDQKWTNAAGSSTKDEYTYTYDRNSNRTAKSNALQSSLSETYAYVGLVRLVDTNRNGSDQQSWTLDSLGNWRSNTTAAGTQARTANAANEIGAITGGGVDWIDPVYDAAGNMTSGPKAGAETTRIHYMYDAWNRLVAVKNDSSGSPGTTIETYEYDGLNHRVQKTPNGGSSEHSYYNEGWQLLEVRVGSDRDPREQYIWDLRYIDAPVVRFYDSNVNGSYADGGDNTLYYTADANMNVTGLVDASTGNAVEHVSYSQYGTPTFYDGSWNGLGASGKANAILFAGYRYDEATGQLYVRNRYLNSALGTWTQRDKEGYVDGFNLGQYVRGNPLNQVDPSGLAARIGIQNAGIVYNMSCAYVTYEGDFAVVEEKVFDAVGNQGKSRYHYPISPQQASRIISSIRSKYPDSGLKSGEPWLLDFVFRSARVWEEYDVPSDDEHEYHDLRPGKNSWSERLRGRTRIVDADFLVAIEAGYTFVDERGAVLILGITGKGGVRQKLPHRLTDIINAEGRPRTLTWREHK